MKLTINVNQVKNSQYSESFRLVADTDYLCNSLPFILLLVVLFELNMLYKRTVSIFFTTTLVLM